jgi:hypothetical protein
MTSRTFSLLPAALLAASLTAQGPDLLLTFSNPESTLSGSGGTVLQTLRPNEMASVQYWTSPCPTSAEKWTPRTAFHTMAGDENADGLYWNPGLFGRIDAIYAPSPSTSTGGATDQRDVFWSVEMPMGVNISPAPFRPGDVARIVRNGFVDGQVEYFMRQEQFAIALGLPPATPLDVDAIAFGPNFGVYFSLDVDIFCPLLCGGTLVRDGDIVCVPPAALAYTPDQRIANALPASAVVVYTEAQVDAMVALAGVADRFGACVPNALDLEALEIDLFGPVTIIPTCTGLPLVVPTLLFATQTMTGASLLTTLGGGAIWNTPCGPTGTPCGFGPTFGPQLGIRATSTAVGAPSWVNGLALARPHRHVLEPQQHVMNVFPFGAPFGSNQIDYGSEWPVGIVFVELVPPTVPGSFPAAPFSQLCFPDLYAPSLISWGPIFGPWGTFPTMAIPPMWTGKVLFQAVGLGGSGFELSTPTVIDVQ